WRSASRADRRRSPEEVGRFVGTQASGNAVATNRRDHVLMPAELMVEPNPSIGVLPLAGFTIGVTADRRADEQIQLLERKGATVLHGPTITTHQRGHQRGPC